MCGELEAQSQNLQWSTHGRLIDVELRSSATYWDPNAACLRYKGALLVQRSFAGTKELCRYKGALPVQRSFAGTKELCRYKGACSFLAVCKPPVLYMPCTLLYCRARSRCVKCGTRSTSQSLVKGSLHIPDSPDCKRSATSGIAMQACGGSCPMHVPTNNTLYPSACVRNTSRRL